MSEYDIKFISYFGLDKVIGFSTSYSSSSKDTGKIFFDDFLQIYCLRTLLIHRNKEYFTGFNNIINSLPSDMHMEEKLNLFKNECLVYVKNELFSPYLTDTSSAQSVTSVLEAYVSNIVNSAMVYNFSVMPDIRLFTTVTELILNLNCPQVYFELYSEEIYSQISFYEDGKNSLHSTKSKYFIKNSTGANEYFEDDEDEELYSKSLNRDRVNALPRAHFTGEILKEAFEKSMAIYKDKRDNNHNLIYYALDTRSNSSLIKLVFTQCMSTDSSRTVTNVNQLSTADKDRMFNIYDTNKNAILKNIRHHISSATFPSNETMKDGIAKDNIGGFVRASLDGPKGTFTVSKLKYFKYVNNSSDIINTTDGSVSASELIDTSYQVDDGIKDEFTFSDFIKVSQDANKILFSKINHGGKKAKGNKVNDIFTFALRRRLNPFVKDISKELKKVVLVKNIRFDVIGITQSLDNLDSRVDCYNIIYKSIGVDNTFKYLEENKDKLKLSNSNYLTADDILILYKAISMTESFITSHWDELGKLTELDPNILIDSTISNQFPTFEHYLIYKDDVVELRENTTETDRENLKIIDDSLQDNITELLALDDAINRNSSLDGLASKANEDDSLDSYRSIVPLKLNIRKACNMYNELVRQILNVGGIEVDPDTSRVIFKDVINMYTSPILENPLSSLYRVNKILSDSYNIPSENYFVKDNLVMSSQGNSSIDKIDNVFRDIHTGKEDETTTTIVESDNNISTLVDLSDSNSTVTIPDSITFLESNSGFYKLHSANEEPDESLEEEELIPFTEYVNVNMSLNSLLRYYNLLWISLDNGDSSNTDFINKCLDWIKSHYGFIEFTLDKTLLGDWFTHFNKSLSNMDTPIFSLNPFMTKEYLESKMLNASLSEAHKDKPLSLFKTEFCGISNSVGYDILNVKNDLITDYEDMITFLDRISDSSVKCSENLKDVSESVSEILNESVTEINDSVIELSGFIGSSLNIEIIMSLLEVSGIEDSLSKSLKSYESTESLPHVISWIQYKMCILKTIINSFNIEYYDLEEYNKVVSSGYSDIASILKVYYELMCMIEITVSHLKVIVPVMNDILKICSNPFDNKFKGINLSKINITCTNYSPHSKSGSKSSSSVAEQKRIPLAKNKLGVLAYLESKPKNVKSFTDFISSNKHTLKSTMYNKSVLGSEYSFTPALRSCFNSVRLRFTEEINLIESITTNYNRGATILYQGIGSGSKSDLSRDEIDYISKVTEAVKYSSSTLNRVSNAREQLTDAIDSLNDTSASVIDDRYENLGLRFDDSFDLGLGLSDRNYVVSIPLRGGTVGTYYLHKSRYLIMSYESYSNSSLRGTTITDEVLDSIIITKVDANPKDIMRALSPFFGG